ncbi:hypothetical protein TrST_g11146 [Triparma strigata]|uniref:Uncharacterized protein n=1 Tax=Triparma strigata TaxID=1606541 RepID=A0A9W7C3Z5_9STRA|nr:hypothetical protein TrST_g11146 [Triparma strigata]
MIYNRTTPSERQEYAALLAENVEEDTTKATLPDDLPTKLNSVSEFSKFQTSENCKKAPLRIPFPTSALALCLCQLAMVLSEDNVLTANFPGTFHGSNRMLAPSSLSVYTLIGFPDSSLKHHGIFPEVSLLPAKGHDTPPEKHRLDHLREKLHYPFNIDRVIRYPGPLSHDQTLPYIFHCDPSISHLRPQIHGLLWQDFAGTGQVYVPWCIYSVLAPNTPPTTPNQ